MSGVLRRPMWTIEFVRDLTLAALVTAFSFSIGHAAQSRGDRAHSQQPNFDSPSECTKCNSNSDVIDNRGITHLTIAAVLAAALGDGDCFRMVRRIEHFSEADFLKQVAFHNASRPSKQDKTNLAALDWHRNRPTRQYAPSAIAEQVDQFRAGRVAVTLASGERRAENAVNWSNAREEL